MAQTVVIDIEARYRDQTAAGTKSTADDVERLRRKLADTETEGNKARTSLEKLSTTAKSLAKTTISIPVKILDYATRPLRGLINYATSLKGILTGIVMGKAGQMLFSNPMGLADQYTNALIGFQTLFKNEQAGLDMMNKLDEFARTTPYKTSNVIAQTQKMLAMGWDAERLIPDMTIVGDAAAATGKGDEGLQRITLALAQIKSKGKLSTEELNQLAEAGIGAKGYIAQGLGYGTDDAGMAKAMKAIEGGKVGGNAAVQMLLAGMERDYAGMMDKMAKETVEGIKSNLEDTFEINIFRKWGQGLQEGAKRGLGSMADMLDANQERLGAVGDKLQEIASFLSNKLADIAEKSIGRVMDVVESEAFNNASIVGKAQMLWDKVISEPFDEWWNSKGQAFVSDAAGKIGTGLGKFYKGSILALLGINAEGAVDGGLSIGAKFAEGFLEGFDADAVWEGIKSALGRAFSSAAKIIPGGEKADSSSYLSAALLGLGASKLIGVGKPIVSGLGGLGSAAAGSTGAMALGKLLTGGTLASGAAGPLTAGALSAYGIAGGAGLVGGALGLTSAMSDFLYSNRTENKKEKSVASWSGAAKLGMVGSGAAAGALVGSIVPVIGTAVGAAVGAGLGGLGALFAGGKVGQKISDSFDGSGKIKKTMEGIEAINEKVDDLTTKSTVSKALIAQYEDVERKLKEGNLNAEEANRLHAEQKSIVEQLAQVYPGLLSQYDLENGKLEEKLGLLKRLSDADRERARKEASIAADEADKVQEDLKNALKSNKENKAEYDAQAAKYKEYGVTAEELANRWNANEELYERGEITKQDYQAERIHIRADAKDLSKEAGVRLNTGSMLFDADTLFKYADKLSEKGNQFNQAWLTEDDAYRENYERYKTGYESKIKSAMLTDLGGGKTVEDALETYQKIAEYQTEINDLTEKLASTEKGSEEYKQIEESVQKLKDKQAPLRDDVEKFKGPLQDVLQLVRDINREYGQILGSDITSTADLGLTEVNKYENPEVSGGKYGITTRGYAKGTLAAPPGYHWVGEEGPELMSMRGGERIYNANASHRMAELYEQSRQRTAAPAGGAQVNLGGLSVTVNAANTGGDAVEALRAQLPEISNELLQIIAVQLDKVYSNMPMRVEGITT